jgi:hypothetical protein
MGSAASEERPWESTKTLPAVTKTPAEDNSTDTRWNSTKNLTTIPGDNANDEGEAKTIEATSPAPTPDTSDAANDTYKGLVDAGGNAGYGGPEESKNEILYYYPSVRGRNSGRWVFTNDFILPVYHTDASALFLNPRSTFDDSGAWEVNVGVGYRHLIADTAILGGNVYYDMSTRYYENSLTLEKKEQFYDQLGTGIEVLTDWVNVRANGYLHLTGDARADDYSYRFSGPGIWGSGRSSTEALSGIDGEVGFKIPGLSDYVETWVYGGGYAFWGEHITNVTGYKTRIEIIPAGLVRMSVGYSNDRINGNQVEGSLALDIPFSVTNLVTGKNPFEGITDRLIGSRTLEARLVEPVNRDIDIKVLTERSESNTGLVEEVVFVSESATVGAGDGTFENPYSTILEAMADARISGGTAHTIHIINDSATDTVPGGTVDVGSLMVWGSGVYHPRYPNILNFVSGYPLITSTVYLDAANVGVMGLSFELTGTRAVEIREDAAGSGFIVSNNLIDLTGTTPNNYGIVCNINGDIGAPGNPAVVSRNIIEVDAPGLNSYGIRLASSGGDIYTTISGNTISGTGGNYAYGIFASAGGDFAGSILGNTISGVSGSFTIGFWYQGGDFAGSISGNTIIGDSGNFGFGLFTFPSGDFTGNITDNILQISGTRAYAAFITASRVGTDLDPLVFTGNSGTIDAATAYLLYLNPVSPADSRVEMGTGLPGTGDNSFDAPLGWDGNYPAAGSPVHNSDYPAYDYITP